MTSEEENGIVSHIVQILLALAFGAWAWVVKVAAAKHIEGVDRIERKVDGLSDRVTRLETKMRIYHHEDASRDSE